MIHKKFFEGRKPPEFSLDNLDHPVNVDWYAEQLDRVNNGFTYKGHRITGDHYWFLNFNPIVRVILDKNNNPTDQFETNYPFWCQPDDYLFKQIEEAYQDKKGVMCFTGRGGGKTYIFSSIGLKTYITIPESHSVFSASNKTHIEETFNKKVIPTLNAIELRHPTLRHKRLVDNSELIVSGEEIDYGDRKQVEGYGSTLEKITYDKEERTDGKRLNFQLWEEVGSWSRKPSLRGCIEKSRGTYFVGGIKKCRDFYIGTGGSVLSDEAKEIAFNPDAFDLYVTRDHKDRKTIIFIPAYKKYGGYYEKTGINDDAAAKKDLEEKREQKKDDTVAYEKFIQQYPFTIDEVFLKSLTKEFSSVNLSKQIIDIETKRIEPKIDVGDLYWHRKDGEIIGVEFIENRKGKIKITSHPDWVISNDLYKISLIDNGIRNLHIAGIDSIDQGNDDSSSKNKNSRLGCLVKRRIDPKSPMSSQNNQYVGLYMQRSDNVKDDYENVAKLLVYFNAIGLLEYTKFRIIDYFREHKLLKYLAKEPDAPSVAILSYKKKNRIGLHVTTDIIKFYIGLIKEYLTDSYYKVFFKELLDQLSEYTYQDKKMFDLIAAMGMCEVYGRELSNINVPIVDQKAEKQIKKMPVYYIDPYTKRKVFGVPPDKDKYSNFITNHDFTI